MREGFPTQDSSIHRYENAPKIPEVSEQQEIPKIFEVLKKYWDREREDKNQPFTQVLDQTEIFVALDETMSYTLEEAKNAVLAFHSDWQRIGEITQLTQESLKGKKLDDLMIYLQMARKFIERISRSWNSACRAYWYRKNRQEGQYRDLRSEFGIDIYDIDAFLTQSQEARAELLSKYPELDKTRKRFHVGKIQVLRNRQRVIEHAIQKIVHEKPEIVRQLIIDLNSSERRIDDRVLDDLFGIKIEEAEKKTNYNKLRAEYPGEEFWQDGFRWTPYELVRTMVKKLKMNNSDVLYDLGSGFGRVPIYASLATGAQCKGIEIVPERVAESIAVQNNFGIDNLKFIQGNVLEQDYRDGTVFFLFNPFAHQTLEAVNEKLRQLAQTKKIKVVSLGPSTSFFDHQDWLRPIESNDRPWGLTIYESQ